MRAVVYKGPKEIAVEEVDDPKIEDPRMLLSGLPLLLYVEATFICMKEGQLQNTTQYLDTNHLELLKRLEMPLPFSRKEIELSSLSILPVGIALTALEALRVLA
jgi:hypothetical protein